jgi:nitroimidazol reductase NimA-like FMN-containing flavoprotein (pyridoxamine 5'-phosphate oxidase superfamily)
MNPAGTGSSTLASGECWSRLRSAAVGRIAFLHDRTGIEMFPVNYVVDHGTLVFRTAAGTKLAGLTSEPAVAVQADGREPEGNGWWSVVVHGRAEPIDRRDDLIAAFDIDLETWQGDAKPYFVRVVPTTVEGVRTSAADESARSLS